MNPNPFMFVYARHGKTHKVFEFAAVIAMSLAQSLLALHRSTIEKRKTPRGKQTYNILKKGITKCITFTLFYHILKEEHNPNILNLWL